MRRTVLIIALVFASHDRRSTFATEGNSLLGTAAESMATIVQAIVSKKKLEGVGPCPLLYLLVGFRSMIDRRL